MFFRIVWQQGDGRLCSTPTDTYFDQEPARARPVVITYVGRDFYSRRRQPDVLKALPLYAPHMWCFWHRMPLWERPNVVHVRDDIFGPVLR